MSPEKATGEYGGFGVAIPSGWSVSLAIRVSFLYSEHARVRELAHPRGLVAAQLDQHLLRVRATVGRRPHRRLRAREAERARNLAHRAELRVLVLDEPRLGDCR